MNKKLLIPTILVFVVGVLGGVGFGVLRKPQAADPAPARKAHAEAVEHGKMVKLDEFLVNLADTASQHYLKVAVVLEVEESPEAEAEIEKSAPKVRDAMISAMSRNDFKTLHRPEGKSALKASLKKAVNGVLGDDLVLNVYFTSFAMQ